MSRMIRIRRMWAACITCVAEVSFLSIYEEKKQGGAGQMIGALDLRLGVL